MHNDKKQRRVKRQLRKVNRQLVALTIKKLFGDTTTEIKYTPDIDPKLSNKQRLVKRRILNGRIKVDGKVFNPKTGDFELDAA